MTTQWVGRVVESALGAFPNGPSRRRMIAWMTVLQAMGYIGAFALVDAYVPSYMRISRVVPLWGLGLFLLLAGALMLATSAGLRGTHWGRLAATAVFAADVWLVVVFFLSGNWGNAGQMLVVVVVLFGEITYVRCHTQK